MNSATSLLHAYEDFLAPPNYLTEKGNSLTTSRKNVRDNLINISVQWPDTEREIAYGVLSAKDLKGLFKGAQKAAWPLLGIGNVAEIVSKAKGWNDETDYPHAMTVTEDDVRRAMTLLNERCSELNKLIQGSSQLRITNGRVHRTYYVLLMSRKVRQTVISKGCDLQTFAI